MVNMTMMGSSLRLTAVIGILMVYTSTEKDLIDMVGTMRTMGNTFQEKDGTTLITVIMMNMMISMKTKMRTMDTMLI